MSPLSDTTNLAPAVAGTDLFTHIRHMTWTTVPAFILALIAYLFLGWGAATAVDLADIANQKALLSETFGVSPVLLVPVLLVFALAVARIPALPALLVCTLIGCLFALMFQYEALGDEDKLKAIWVVLISGYVPSSADETLNSLLSVGGMASMLNTIWLIITAMAFGAVMEKLGFLNAIVSALLGAAKRQANLILSVAGTCMGVNVLAPDQYMSVVISGRMFRSEFEQQKLAPQNLSRVLEDAGTVTSALVPWNTCGAFLSGVLGVYTWSYAPYCFFNFLCPIFTIAYGFLSFSIVPMEEPVLAEEAG